MLMASDSDALCACAGNEGHDSCLARVNYVAAIPITSGTANLLCSEAVSGAHLVTSSLWTWGLGGILDTANTLWSPPYYIGAFR